jgi:hypothetical protein
MIYTNFTRPEGARRNLLTYSEQFDNAAWIKANTTVSANAAAAPYGTDTADVLIPNTTSGVVHDLNNQSAQIQPDNTTITLSCFAKDFGQRYLWLRVVNRAGQFRSIAFDLQTGDFNKISSETEGTIVYVGNGWYRCSNTVNVGVGLSGASGRAVIAAAVGMSSGLEVFAGDGTSGIYIWGAQLEVGGLTAYQPVVSGLEFDTEPLNHARIGYQNLTYGLTATASSAAAGFPAIAATYPTTFEYWTPTALPAAWGVDFGSAKSVDYCGIVGDLNGATIEIQSSSNFSTWTARGTIGPTTDRINMALFLETSVRYWRLYVTGGLPNIAVVHLGKALAMQRKIYQGHTPLTLSRTTELSNNMSDGGQYLGRSVIRKGAQTSCNWSHLKADWYRANFDPFVKAARTGPFFIGWRPESYPSELGYVWTDNDIAPTNSGPRDFMSVGVSFMGLINE